MDYFAGLDVSVKETSVCIVDDTGKIVREVKVASGHAGCGLCARSTGRQLGTRSRNTEPLEAGLTPTAQKFKIGISAARLAPSQNPS